MENIVLYRGQGIFPLKPSLRIIQSYLCLYLHPKVQIQIYQELKKANDVCNIISLMLCPINLPLI